MTTTLVPSDTKALLANLPASACSRSLYFDRYAKPEAQRAEQSNFFTEGFRAHASTARVARWSAMLPDLSANVLYAQLQSRLMVNMAGGVMENAGLCLDRFGMPYLPGSAVKGCARRAALAALHEWCETKAKPGESPSDQDNLFKAACAPFGLEIEMLIAIAKVFGWCDQDWKDRSDFAWACGPGQWDDFRDQARGRIGQAADSPGKSRVFGARGGSVSWLPAMPCDLGGKGAVQGLPLELPSLGLIELDVLTCHHRRYYSQEPDDDLQATDTEEPVPVFFPAVAAGHVFAFALRPIQAVDEQLLMAAQAWLKCGLETLGIGAKTNAGYGWFADVTHAALELDQRRKTDEQRRAAIEAQKRLDAAAKEQAEAERERRRAIQLEREALPPDVRADKDLEDLSAEQFDGKVRAFCKEPKKGGPTDEEKKAIIRALRGARLDYWNAFKDKARRGGEVARVEHAIRELSKVLHPGKEGKMP